MPFFSFLFFFFPFFFLFLVLHFTVDSGAVLCFSPSSQIQCHPQIVEV